MATALVSRSRRRIRPLAPARPAQLVRACDSDELDLLEGAWSELDGTARCPSAQYCWTRACQTAFADEAAPHVVAMRDDGQMLAVAPLVRKRCNGVYRLFLAGACQLQEPIDFNWTQEAALERVAQVLVRGGYPLELARMPADSPAVAALVRAGRGRAAVRVRAVAPYLSIYLDERWVEPQQQLDETRRDELRRARRQAEQLGPVTTEIHMPGLHELPDLLDTAFEVEAQRGPEPCALRAAGHLQRAVFYRQFFQAACEKGTLRICFLRIGNRVAAMQVAVESDGAFWTLKSASDPRYAACTPGRLLLRDTIRYAAEAALERLEFWGQSEGGTQIWPARPRPCVSVAIYPYGLRGLTALAADAAVTSYRQWRR